MVIYRILNQVNGKVYVGQTTKTFNLRVNNHRYDLRKQKHCNQHFQKAWNKYGEEAFLFEEIVSVIGSFADLDEVEKYWINYFDSTNPEKGYNLSLGGQSNRVISEETRKKISLSLIGNKRSLGKKQNLTEEQRERRSLVTTKMNKERGSLSEETRKKISAALSGPKSLHYGKPGVNRKTVICLNNGVTYQSASVAAKQLNCDRSTICKVCRGDVKQIKGYKFIYAIIGS